MGSQLLRGYQPDSSYLVLVHNVVLDSFDPLPLIIGPLLPLHSPCCKRCCSCSCRSLLRSQLKSFAVKVHLIPGLVCTVQPPLFCLGTSKRSRSCIRLRNDPSAPATALSGAFQPTIPGSCRSRASAPHSWKGLDPAAQPTLQARRILCSFTAESAWPSHRAKSSDSSRACLCHQGTLVPVTPVEEPPFLQPYPLVTMASGGLRPACTSCTDGWLSE